ncbi:MAG TPA: DUF4214 domain-containing protein [Pyrinomonadaceae bacterium]|jgi:hypothetical protein
MRVTREGRRPEACRLSLPRYASFLLSLFCLLAAGATARAATINVAAGGDLQAAINQAQPGDTIVLVAGATYSGNYRLPNKQGDGYVTVQSSMLASLPEGQRVTPAQSGLMPKIESLGHNEGAIATDPGAHHYRFLGVEFTVRPGVTENALLVLGGPVETNPLNQPNELVFDRCYVHAPGAYQLRRAFALNSRKAEVTNSYISNIKYAGFETQAISVWNGPGPFKIVNNYLEASGENIMFGGALAQNERMNPADIEVRNNHFYKPTEWRGVYTVKNLFELKNARRVTVTGNLFEHNWVDAQAGYAVLFTPRPNDSGDTAAVEDVTFANNVVRGVAAAVNVIGSDPLYAAAPNEVRGRRIAIRNNLFLEVGGQWGGDGAFLKIGNGADQVSVDHNTVLHTGNVTKAMGASMTAFSFTNNVMSHNDYGVHGDSAGVGLGAINMYFAGSYWARNVIAGAPESRYPTNNFYPASLADVAFIDGPGGDYRLSPASPYRGQATDGKDLGCDFAALEKAMAGNGQTSPPQTPTPTPTPVPTPIATPTPTPTPTPAAEPRAQRSLRGARRDAQDLSNALAVTSAPSAPPPANAIVANPADRIAAVASAIQQAYLDLEAERALYPAAGRAETSLSSALTHAASASSYAAQGQMAEARSALQKAIDCLELADVLMVYGNVENPLDYAEYFVRQHYVDFLGREPDESGRAYWTSKIKNCGASPQCVETMRIDVSAAYFRSIEFQQTGYVVYRLYRGSLGRTVSFGEFVADTQEVEKGIVVGEAGWQELLTANKRAFYQAWVQRADFRARYDRLTSAQFVDALYASMGVTPPAAERDAALGSLAAGASRADVLAKIIENEEFSRMETNKAFVLMEYFGYMRRDPDAAGYAHWLGKLEEFGGDYVRAEMVKAFLSSTEYRDRFRQW